MEIGKQLMRTDPVAYRAACASINTGREQGCATRLHAVCMFGSADTVRPDLDLHGSIVYQNPRDIYIRLPLMPKYDAEKVLPRIEGC